MLIEHDNEYINLAAAGKIEFGEYLTGDKFVEVFSSNNPSDAYWTSSDPAAVELARQWCRLTAAKARVNLHRDIELIARTAKELK